MGKLRHRLSLKHSHLETCIHVGNEKWLMKIYFSTISLDNLLQRIFCNKNVFAKAEDTAQGSSVCSASLSSQNRVYSSGRRRQVCLNSDFSQTSKNTFFKKESTLILRKIYFLHTQSKLMQNIYSKLVILCSSFFPQQTCDNHIFLNL